MSNNLVIGENGKLCIASSSFASAGLTSQNCTIVQRIGDGGGSWKPGRSINLLTTMTEGEVYRIKMIAAADLSTVLAPPLPTVVVNPIYSQSAFTAADSTTLTAYQPEVGPKFTIFDGAWQVQSNKAVNFGTKPSSTQWVALTDLANKTDVKITAVVSTINGAGFSIWLRAANAAGPYSLILIQIGEVVDGDGNQDYSITVGNYVSGSQTDLTTVPAAINNVNGTNVTVVVTLIGNTLNLSLNGTAYITNLSIPSGQTNTKFGFGTVNANTAQDVRFDSFVIENPSV